MREKIMTGSAISPSIMPSWKKPSSSYELPLKPNTACHLLVLKGRAKLVTGLEEKTLRSGEAIACGAEEQAHIENAAKTELSLIQVELKNQVDDYLIILK